MSNPKTKAQIAPSDHTEILNLKEETRFVKLSDRDDSQQKQVLSQESNQKADLEQLNPQKNQHLQKSQTIFNIVYSQLPSKRFYYINRFTQKIKQYSSYYKFTQTKKRFLEIVDDYAFDYDVFFFKNVFQYDQPTRLQTLMKSFETWFTRSIVTLDQKSGIIMLPSSYVNTIWNIIQFTFLIIYIIYLPIRLAFDSLHQDADYFAVFEVIPNVIQIINMFLEFNTGIYKHGQIILDRWEICLNYITSKFIFDLGLNICWLVSLNPHVSLWLKCVGLLRLITMLKIIDELEEANSLKETYGNLFELLKLSSFIFLCAHLACCCWYALAVYEDDIDVELTWLKKDISQYQLDPDLNLKVQGYIAGMYFCIVTMTTIGYGDITPSTYRERIFALIFCILSCFSFAFTMGSIGEIVKKFSLKGEEFKQKMEMLNLYMKKRNLSPNLQVRVRKFYENQNQEQSENNEFGSSMIDNLIPDLRKDVQKDIYSYLFKNIKFFQVNFSERLIQNIYRIVEEKQFQIDEKIFEEGQKSEKLYVIIKGEVQLILQGRHDLIKMGEGEVLGLSEFFSQQPYQFSAKASRSAQFAIINYNDFVKLAAECKNDLEVHCQIKDTILLNKDLNKIQGVICQSCGKTDHIFQNCQMISLNQNKLKDLVEQDKRKQLTRQQWYRRSQIYQTLANKQLIEQRAQEFLENLELLKMKADIEQLTKQLTGRDQSMRSSNADFLNDNQIFEDLDEDSVQFTDKLIIDQNLTGKKLAGEEQQVEIGQEQSPINQINYDSFQINPKPEEQNQIFFTKIQINSVQLHSIAQSNENQQGGKFQGMNKELKVNTPQSSQKLIQQNRKKSVNLTMRTSKVQLDINQKGTDLLSKNKAALDDLKKQVEEEIQMKHDSVAQKTIISAINEKEVKEEYSFDQHFDQMNAFKSYLIHNNYNFVIKRFNHFIEKNKLYQELIIKAKRKKLEKQQTVKRLTKIRENTYKKIPTTQKFFMMKQRSEKLSKEQTLLNSQNQEKALISNNNNE